MSINKKTIFPLLIAAIVLFPAQTFAAVYNADPVYSSVVFKVKELTGYVSGLFNSFGATVELSDDNSRLVSVKAAIDTSSIYTRNVQRDRDLLGPDLLNAIKFPKAVFVSKEIAGNKITGDLTIRDKTKEVVLEYTLGKPAQDQWGRTAVPMTAKGTISRKDFGILYNRKLDNGGFLIDDKVDLDIQINGILQK